MIEKIIERFESLPFVIASGIALLGDLIPHILDIEPIFHFSYIAVAICGLPILYSALRKLLFNKGLKRISSALLISIAMICAICIGDVFAAGEVAFIMAIGEMLEHLTTKRAKKGLKNLIDLTPKTARRITNNNDEIIEYTQIKKGDILRVLPGETIPSDGVIINGETSVDEAIMTGESMPVDKCMNDEVYCGTINRFGVIDIEASRVGDDSSLERLIKMVKDAEDKKAPTERITDKWASILVPVALLVAVLAGFIRQDISVAVTILVVFCPCALVLATPTAIMAAIGQATKHGIIIKSGDALEKMGKVDAIAFDKTGTLTLGKLNVCDVVAYSTDTDTLLSFAASAESLSEHPLGKAITEYAKSNGIAIFEPTEFTISIGRGIIAVVNDTKLICGNMQLIEDNGIELTDEMINKLIQFQKQGKASVIIASNTVVIGIIALSDVLKPEAKDTIDNLLKLRTKTVLLTGDNEKTARYFADRAGISNVYAELLPQDKVSKIQLMQSDKYSVAMVGDGVNDAPSLKTADIGIAMGGMGSDIAEDAADIVLLNDDISKLPYLKRLSCATVNTIRFGITLSLLINFIGIVLSFMKLLTPITGALVHNAGSVIVVLIAAMLYDRKF